jgi:hypothetical protein
VDAKNLSVDNGSQSEEIEDLAAGLPYGSIAILCLTLFVEAVHLSDLSRLVVSAD